MTFDLCPRTRDEIARSASRQELLDFGDWLESQRYAPFVCDQHLRRLAFILPRLSHDGRPGTYSSAQLKKAFGPERSPPSRLYRFAATRRVYQRFLLGRGRLRVVKADDRFAPLRRDYAHYLVEVRGLSLSARLHHASIRRIACCLPTHAAER